MRQDQSNAFRARCALAASLCVAACVTTSGRLEANRFQHAEYPYALFYVPLGRPESPLGPHYRLENFRSPDGHHLYARSGSGFTIARSYPDTSPPLVKREPFYDLLLSRDEPKAAFWLRSVPLRPEQGALPLATLAAQYLTEVARAGRVAVPMGVEARAVAAPRRAELRDPRQSPCELSKREALRLDFQVEDLSAARGSGGPSWKQGSVVLVRSGYLARDKYPVLLLAGRSSMPEASAQLEPDFDRMLQLLVLGDKGQGLSMKGGSSCGPASAGGPPETVAPPAESAPPANTTPELEVPIIQDDGAPPAELPPESP
jgi:hypothetical protein